MDERNRQLRIKLGEERHSLNEKIKDLTAHNDSLTRQAKNLAAQLAEQPETSETDIDPIELTNKLNALLGKGRPPRPQLSVKEVRKALSELKPE